MTDLKRRKAGYIQTMLLSEKQVRNYLIHKRRRQIDESYLNPEGPKSALVTGEGNDE